VLDVAFRKDGSRLRKDDRPESMALLSKVALTAARADIATKSGIIGRNIRRNILNNCFFKSPLPLVQGDLYALALVV
jgi:hypothetical protein